MKPYLSIAILFMTTKDVEEKKFKTMQDRVRISIADNLPFKAEPMLEEVGGLPAVRGGMSDVVVFPTPLFAVAEVI